MLQTRTEALGLIRDITLDNIGAVTRFAFSFSEDEDVSALNAGHLFQQNEDFFLFEADLVDSRRVGPSQASPTRCWGELTITLYTKNPARELFHKALVEAASDWFAEKTLRDIRFRTFIPLSTAKVMGFTSYSGAINFDFDISRG